MDGGWQISFRWAYVHALPPLFPQTHDLPSMPPLGQLVAVLLVHLWSRGGPDTIELSLLLQRKPGGFILPEPFLTLPKFPDHLLHPLLSPSVKRDNEQFWGAQNEHTHTRSRAGIAWLPSKGCSGGGTVPGLGAQRNPPAGKGVQARFWRVLGGS